MDLYIDNLVGYELLGSGDGRKLERIGDVIIDRPSPQAIWKKDESAPWDSAQAVFKRKEGGTGDWIYPKDKPLDAWLIELGDLKFEIRLTGFGNIGVFPEHFAHFDWMSELISKRENPKILNLFAYTGGASMACARAGATVTHVDAAKSVNGWAISNAKQSGIPKEGLRFLADDALKFVNREDRRGNSYDGIILDPPTFGRGTKGEVWKIERDLFKLLDASERLLSENPQFVLLTCHSPGITPSVLSSMLESLGKNTTSGEMLLRGSGPPLPAGAFARWTPKESH